VAVPFPPGATPSAGGEPRTAQPTIEHKPVQPTTLTVDEKTSSKTETSQGPKRPTSTTKQRGSEPRKAQRKPDNRTARIRSGAPASPGTSQGGGVDPATAAAIGTMIDVGIGVGLNHTRRGGMHEERMPAGQRHRRRMPEGMMESPNRAR
jgi:hypothetical protein